MNIVEHLEKNPEDFRELTSAVKVRIANRAAIETFAYDPAEHGNRIPFASEGSRRSFLQQVAAVWEGRSEMRYEFARESAAVGPTNCALHWSAPKTPQGPDFGHVVISIADVAARHSLEVQLRQQVDQLALLRDINRGISSNADPGDVLRTITAGVCRVLEASWAEMLLLDESFETVTERIAVGLETATPGPVEFHQRHGRLGAAQRPGNDFGRRRTRSSNPPGGCSCSMMVRPGRW